MRMKVNALRIRELRTQKSWTQEDLADKADVNVRTIQRAEANSSASVKTIASLAHALGIESSELATASSNPFSNPFSMSMILIALIWSAVMMLTGIVFIDNPESGRAMQDILAPASAVTILVCIWGARRYRKLHGPTKTSTTS